MRFENKQEANTLLALIDMAVKSGGLQVAEAGLHFTKKIKADFPEQDADLSVPANGPPPAS